MQNHLKTFRNKLHLERHLKGQITVGCCSFFAYFNQLLFSAQCGVICNFFLTATVIGVNMSTGKILIKALVFLGLTFILVGELNAKESKGGALEKANLTKAIYCMEILESRNDLEPSQRISILRNECYADNFVEHSPHISGGREGLFSIFLNRYKEYPKLSMSIKRSASQGDLVWLHLHVKRTPDSLGAVLIHIFRMKDGMIVEHWGVGQPIPENPKNNNTMF